MKYFSLGFFAVLISFTLLAQPRWDAARIQLEMEKLPVVGNALYLAAHPDDENTRLIAWMANEVKMRTAYLSLTRGDGGQNLIGTEKGPYMGLIRTQELREARKLDGGEQFFTRAVDFGYSKTPEETLKKWNRDSVLSDVVATIRKFKPDVIVLRFPPTSYAGHGHHTASALLAEEAFDLVNDPKAFPWSAKKYGTWKVQRLLFNDSPWWDKNIEERKDEYITVDVGTFNPLLGRSYTEVAGMSRSQHRSQGFGASLAKGGQVEYLKPIKGDNPSGTFISGLALNWSERVKGGGKVEQVIEELLKAFDPSNPAQSLPLLVELHEQIKATPPNPWKSYKLEQVKEIILACGGIWFELLAESPQYAVGDSIELNFQILSQVNADINIVSAHVEGKSLDLSTSLSNDMIQTRVKLLPASSFINPYWLTHAAVANLFSVSNYALLGQPQNDAPLNAEITLEAFGHNISYDVPVRYKWVDRADGELYKELHITPMVTANPEKNTLVFTSAEPKRIQLKVTQQTSQEVEGNVVPIVPDGWSVTPEASTLALNSTNPVAFIEFELTPPAEMTSGFLTFQLGDTPLQQQVNIEYPHIEQQLVFPESAVKLVHAPAKIRGKHVGYIMGAGDDVPVALEELGYRVHPIESKTITLNKLKTMDVVVMGIRAYNTEKSLEKLNGILLEYVENGGHLVVQYNTNRGLVVNNFAPYELALSRKRVTVEEAEARLIVKDHPLLKTPNAINQQDFDNWVQERGLYFAGEWDESKFDALISWNDPGEEPGNGGLLVADYGKGTFIYTGISFFRQLPAGVPGAYRLFANIMSYGQGE